MAEYLSAYDVCIFAVELADKLNMLKIPTIEELLLLVNKRNALQVVFSDGLIKMWVDKLYIAYSFEYEQEIHYAYVSDIHIREETISFTNARFTRHKNINLPIDIQKQFEKATEIMKLTRKKYIIFKT
jgi:hypothetical protein